MYNVNMKQPTTVREQIVSYGNVADIETKDLLTAYLSLGSKANKQGLAENLLDKVAIDQIVDLDYGTLMDLGLSESKAVGLLSVIELTKRSMESTAQREAIFSSEKLGHRMMTLLGTEKQEVLRVLYLNTQNQIIEERDIFKGSVNRSIGTPREILYYACRNMATSLIIVHNHPSGAVEPSKNDFAFTSKIKTSCEALDIFLLDHIVVGRSDYYSFRENEKL